MTSTGVSETLDGLPHLDLAPLRHLIDDLNSAKEKDVLIQLRVMEFDASASFLVTSVFQSNTFII